MPIIDRDFAIFLAVIFIAYGKICEMVGVICFAYYIAKHLTGE